MRWEFPAVLELMRWEFPADLEPSTQCRGSRVAVRLAGTAGGGSRQVLNANKKPANGGLIGFKCGLVYSSLSSLTYLHAKFHAMQAAVIMCNRSCILVCKLIHFVNSSQSSGVLNIAAGLRLNFVSFIFNAPQLRLILRGSNLYKACTRYTVHAAPLP